MMCLKYFISIITIIFLFNKLQAQSYDWKREITPFSGIEKNALKSITGFNSLFHLGGIVTTYGIIKTGTDYKIHNYFSKNRNTYNTPSIPAVYIGYTVPVCLGVGFYSYGLLKNNPKSAAAGCSVLQASALAFTENCLLKAFTGRPAPDAFEYSKETDRSKVFRFGFMRGGIHYGWPSGHMAVATAVISSLTNFYSDSKIVKATTWISWSYMFLGVIAHEGNTMHWFSDAVAGSMMGYAIGSSVGSGFRELYINMDKKQAKTYYLQPQIQAGSLGFAFGCSF